MPGINSTLGIDRLGGSELEVTNDTNLPQWRKTALERLSYREMMFSTGCQFGVFFLVNECIHFILHKKDFSPIVQGVSSSGNTYYYFYFIISDPDMFGLIM